MIHYCNNIYKVLAIFAYIMLVPYSSVLAQNNIQMEEAEIRQGGTTDIIIKLNNIDSFSGFQMDITLGDGLALVDNSFALNEERLNSNFTISSSHRDNGDYRILVGSMPVSEIVQGNGEIVRFKVQASNDFNGSVVTLKNILFTTNKLEEVPLADQFCNVNLSKKLVESISLDKVSASLMVGETLTLQAAVLPIDADNSTVTWSTNNPAVASVSDEGVVTALSVGTAMISVTANDGSNVSASCTVSVTTNIFSLKYFVDGILYKESNIKYGAEITPEAEPTKEGYTFSGWSEIPATMPAHDVEVNGSFTINKYTIKFVNEDGSVLQSSEVEYGVTPVYSGSTPTKASTAEYSYTFAGWTPEIVAVKADATYTATYTSTVNKYIIKFVNEDGTVLQSSEVEYGVTPVYSGSTPTKASTAEYSYTFTGWTPEIVAATADATYTATYTSTTNQYKLTYKVDGAVYKEYTLNYGDAITPEAEPTKEGYTFSGWSEIPATMPAHDVEVTGSFTKGAYKLTYYVDGAKYKELSYDFGDTITPEAEPTKEGYTFSGWSEIPATMPAHDVEVNGSFTINKYTIKFVNEDGSLLQSSEVEYGVTPVYSGSTPTKASTAEYSYTFAGWTPEIVAVTADATYTATYTSTTNQYKLTYKVDGAVYKEYTLNYGDAITPEAEPTREGYTFSGWSEIPATMPAHDVEVTGSFTKGAYKLTYYVDGAKYKEVSYDFGDAITPEAEPTKEGYTFSGWSEIPATMPAHDVEVTGSFTKGAYKLTYYVDGAKYKEVSYDFGDAITPEAEPTKEGYTFSGWSEIPATMPAHDVEVNGSFTINKYTIKFVNEDGSLLQSSEFEYGATPVYSGTTPTKAATAEISYTFAGWTPEIVVATADATYTATYTSTQNQYKLTYKIDGEVYKEYTLSYGDAITPEVEPTKEGYTFSGWSEIPATMPAHDVEVTGTFEINVTEVILPVVEEGSDIDEENAEDITEFKLTLNNVETFEVNEDASAELLIDGVLSGTAGKDDISEEDGVVTIKFNFVGNEENAPAKLKAFWHSVAQASADEVPVEVIIAAGSFNINGEDVTEDISYSYTAPASVAEEIEETLSSIRGIAVDEDSIKVYNLNGIRVNKNQKGIVIKNGKTFFVK